MAYDQAGDDANLVNQNNSVGNIYRPVADIDWVEKIATLALRDIPAKKIILTGLPRFARNDGSFNVQLNLVANQEQH